MLNRISFTTVAAALLLAGCTKNFDKLNTDPNSASASTYNPVYNLSRAQLEFTGNSDFSYEIWRVNIIYAGMMVQHLANASWYAGDKYMQNDAWAASHFEVAYRDQVKYVVDLMQLTKDKPLYHNLHQVGRIMRVLIAHRITDTYGDVPYSEAGLGYYNRIFTPKYDRQQDIYLSMLKELEEAAQSLDPAKDKPGDGDLIYKGGTNAIQQWKRLAYSLMLRLAMRMTKVDANTARTWAEKAAAGGVMQSNDDNAYVIHDASGGRNTVNRNSNILSGEWNATNRGEVYLSRTFVDFLKNNNDPRLQHMARVRSTGSSNPADQVGLPNGYDQNGGATDVTNAPNFPGSINNYSTIRADVLLRLNGPTFLVTYAQTQLLLAEAAKRGWNVSGNAATYYNNGVRAAMKQLSQYNSDVTIPDAAIDAYLLARPYVDANGFEMINTQYWAASFLDWYETWANWRRSGFPVLTPVNYPGNATGGQIPRRMLYPSSESSANAANYQEAISRQGANTFTTRVWWDKP